MSIVQRLILFPVALGPWLFSDLSDSAALWWFILLTAVNRALLHFATPLWLSWMGDYLPHNGLNHFWGIRHLWMQWAGAASLLCGAVFLYSGGLD